MTQVSIQELQTQLTDVKSIGGIQKVLADQGLSVSEVQIAQQLIAEGLSPRFAGLSPSAQEQVAHVIVLAEHNPAVAQVLMSPEQATAQLPALLAAEGLSLDAEALEALSKPLELDDAQLEQVVGGIDPALITLITFGITTAATVATLLINRYFDYKDKTVK